MLKSVVIIHYCLQNMLPLTVAVYPMQEISEIEFVTGELRLKFPRPVATLA